MNAPRIVRLRGEATDLVWPDTLTPLVERCRELRAHQPKAAATTAHERAWWFTFDAARAACTRTFAVANGMVRATSFLPSRLLGRYAGSEPIPDWASRGLDHADYCCVRGNVPFAMIGHNYAPYPLEAYPESLIVDAIVGDASWYWPGHTSLIVVRRGLPYSKSRRAGGAA